MSYKRIMVQDSGLARNSRVGDTLENPVIVTVAADAAATLTVAQIQAGVVMFTGLTAGRVLTTDTAANILAALPEMDIGDSIALKVAAIPAFALTLAAGTGVTLAGRATVPASTCCDCYITKTSATAVTFVCL